MRIIIDITDWKDEIEEEYIFTKEELIEELMQGAKTRDVARKILVSREAAVVDPDVIAPNKHLLLAGTQRHLAGIMAEYKLEKETPSGRMVHVSEFVGTTSRKGKEASYVHIDQDEALNRAVTYLLNLMEAHARSRLTIVMAKDGDVKGIVRKMKAQLTKIVKDLS